MSYEQTTVEGHMSWVHMSWVYISWVHMSWSLRSDTDFSGTELPRHCSQVIRKWRWEWHWAEWNLHGVIQTRLTHSWLVSDESWLVRQTTADDNRSQETTWHTWLQVTVYLRTSRIWPTLRVLTSDSNIISFSWPYPHVNGVCVCVCVRACACVCVYERVNVWVCECVSVRVIVSVLVRCGSHGFSTSHLWSRRVISLLSNAWSTSCVTLWWKWEASVSITNDAKPDMLEQNQILCLLQRCGVETYDYGAPKSNWHIRERERERTRKCVCAWERTYVCDCAHVDELCNHLSHSAVVSHSVASWATHSIVACELRERVRETERERDWMSDRKRWRHTEGEKEREKEKETECCSLVTRHLSLVTSRVSTKWDPTWNLSTVEILDGNPICGIEAQRRDTTSYELRWDETSWDELSWDE